MEPHPPDEVVAMETSVPPPIIVTIDTAISGNSHCLVCATPTTTTPITEIDPVLYFLKELLKYQLLSTTQIAAMEIHNVFFCQECLGEITTAHSHHVQILTLTTQLESLRSTLEDKILATLNSEHELDFYAAQVRRRVREESSTITPEIKIKLEPPEELSSNPFDFLSLEQIQVFPVEKEEEEKVVERRILRKRAMRVPPPPPPRPSPPRPSPSLPTLIRCPLCPQTLPRHALAKHIAQNHKRQFTCAVCGMTFGRRDYFLVHRACHSEYPDEEEEEEKKPPPVVVRREKREVKEVAIEDEEIVELLSSCGSESSSEEDEEEDDDEDDEDFSPRGTPRKPRRSLSSAAPLPSSHPLITKRRGRPPNLAPRPPKKPKKEAKSCPLCPVEFFSFPKMIRHLNADHETKPAWFCPVCEKGFLREDFLQSHLRGSHQETTTPPDPPLDTFQEKLSERTCPVCYKLFERPSMMSTHHTHVHDSNSPGFICEICAKCFKRRDSLRKHLEFHSTGDDGKIFKCDECGKGFRRKRDMEVHQRLHTGVKELLCSLCGQSFRHEWSFRRHNILLHGLRPSKKYDCSVCGKSFKIKWHLDQHLKSKSHGGEGLGRRVRKRKIGDPTVKKFTAASRKIHAVTNREVDRVVVMETSNSEQPMDLVYPGEHQERSPPPPVESPPPPVNQQRRLYADPRRQFFASNCEYQQSAGGFSGGNSGSSGGSYWPQQFPPPSGVGFFSQ
ncbi:zinc finger and BTB domain-containing protein 47 [Folsomia candida]|uniref:zinc finger and BTB domain-containing protein 47 n=1 Tax=Folsomia candida TaxID=158441 RepID=UPI000B8EF634|nr:zinc finger and BTB domain-containing protein 47 [Folsomia candida]